MPLLAPSHRHLSSAVSPPSHRRILSLLGQCAFPAHFQQLLARLIRQGDAADPFVAARMLEACPDAAVADAIFAAIGRPDNTLIWTAMIRCHVAARNPLRAIELYDGMRLAGVGPYKFSFVFALKACSMVGERRKGTCLHGAVVKAGLSTDAYLRSALVNLYSSCGDAHSAHRVFGEVPGDENLAVRNAMIAGFFANGEPERAKSLFDEMRDRDMTTWNVVLNWYSKHGRIDAARRLFDEMPERDLLSWSSVMTGYVQNGRAVEAVALFREMLRAGVKPDAVTISTALAACAQVGALDMGKWIHSYVDKNRVRRDVVLATSLVDMYAKCGSINMALQVFRRMELKNVASWNAMLCGLAMHGHGKDVLAMFQEMELAHASPTDVTFVAILSACSHIGAVAEGRRQFDRMRHEFDIMPKIEHYGCMVDLLGRAGLMDEARNMIMSMPMEPSVVILGSYLSACKMHGNLNPGEWFVRLVPELDPGDGWFHVLLSNIYASRSQWEEVTWVRKLMKWRGVQKIPGCSWVEVDNVVHKFVVEDQSCPSWREVFNTITQLTSHLEAEGYAFDRSSCLR